MSALRRGFVVQSCRHVWVFVTPWIAARRLPCPSPPPRVCSNSCPSSRWCHPTISSSVIPFSSCPQSFPASGSFLVSQFLASGGQSIGTSASASVLLMNIQGWFPLGFTGLISLLSEDIKPGGDTLCICTYFCFAVRLSDVLGTTQRTWFWGSSGSWWWIGKPGVLQSLGLQRVGHDWATELKYLR